MTNDINSLFELKNKIERMKSERDRAKGASDQIMKQIEKEFGCKSIKTAKKLLAEQKKELAQKEQILNKEAQQIQKELEQYDSH